MKAEHVAVYLDFRQAHVMRMLASEALRNADEDLELVQKMHSASARGWVQVTISERRDVCQELVDKAKEASEKFCDGEYDDGEYDDGE